MTPSSAKTQPQHTQHTLTTVDGHSLFYRTFEPCGQALATVVVVHGYLEHSGRYTALAQALSHKGLRVLAADLRGHGQSSGPRGHIVRFSDYRNDMFDVLAAAQLITGPAPLFVIGHSLGGLISLDYALTKAPKLAGLVLSNPFIAPALNIFWGKRMLGRITQGLWPSFAVKANLDPNSLTRDRAILEQSQHDPLMFNRTTARWFHEVTLAQKRVQQGGALSMPLLTILGMADAIASPDAALACCEALHTPDTTIWQRAGERHEVFNELDRERLFDEVATWLLSRAAGDKMAAPGAKAER